MGDRLCRVQETTGSKSGEEEPNRLQGKDSATGRTRMTGRRLIRQGRGHVWGSSGSSFGAPSRSFGSPHTNYQRGGFGGRGFEGYQSYNGRSQHSGGFHLFGGGHQSNGFGRGSFGGGHSGWGGGGFKAPKASHFGGGGGHFGGGSHFGGGHWRPRRRSWGRWPRRWRSPSLILNGMRYCVRPVAPTEDPVQCAGVME